MFVNPTSAFPGPASPRRIDFGSAWYARWANESPSTTRSGRVRERPLWLRDRLLEPIGRGAGCSAERARRGRRLPDRRPTPRRSRASLSCPRSRPGRAERPPRARCVPRRCQRASWRFRSPFLRRVPSGNMTTAWPCRRSSIAVPIASSSRSPRRTRNRPGGHDRPRGNQKSSDFAMKAQGDAWKHGYPERPGRSSTSGSRRARARPRAGRSRPVARSRKTAPTSGQLTVATTK